jgi:hypothetical protein
MDWFWTWGGKCFGYRRGDKLFAHHGLQVGKFYRDEVYGSDGRYLGEIRSSRRLITNRSKIGWRKYAFGPVQSGAYAPYADYVGYVMYAGYEDFPSPDDFR